MTLAAGVEVTDGLFGVWLDAGADVWLDFAATVAVAGALIGGTVALAAIVAVGCTVAGALLVAVAGADVGGTTAWGAQAAATSASTTIPAKNVRLCDCIHSSPCVASRSRLAGLCRKPSISNLTAQLDTLIMVLNSYSAWPPKVTVQLLCHDSMISLLPASSHL